jgi:signal peptidase I
MMKWLKNVIVLASAFALMLAFRALAFSVHTVSGNGLAPLYQHGDRILVNRCSYGLRIAGNGLLPYSRLMRCPVKRGDIVAFLAPDRCQQGVMIARCKAVPGDTVNTQKGKLVVPGLKTCAKADYYWLEALNKRNPADSRHLGFISERDIIGEVTTILYNRKNLRMR